MIAACGGLMYYGYSQVSGGGDIAVEFDQLFEEIAEGRAGHYYSTRTTAAFKRATTKDEFVSLAEAINQKLGKLDSKTVSGFRMYSDASGTSVDAAYDCQFEHGKGSVKTTFKRADSGWHLHGFRVDSPELVRVATRKKCPHCGEPYEVGAKFCPNCGKEIADSESSDEP
jgi:hypothetical protein